MNDFILQDYISISFEDIPNWILSLIRDIQIYYKISNPDNYDPLSKLRIYHWLNGLGKPYFIDYLNKLGIEHEFFDIKEDNGYQMTLSSGIVFKHTEELTKLILAKSK